MLIVIDTIKTRSFVQINITFENSSAKKYDFKNYYCSFVFILIVAVNLVRMFPISQCLVSKNQPLFNITVFILLFFLAGCSWLPNDLKRAEEIVENQPDSALKILQNLPDHTFISDADRANYGILYFEALDNTKSELEPDSIINFSLNYYLGHNDNLKLAKAYYFKAKTLKLSQRFDDATELYLKSLKILDNSNNYRLLAKIYSDIADISTIQKDYTEALKKYNESIEFFKLAGDSVEASYRNIYIGRVYRLMNDHKTALNYYRKTLQQTDDSLTNGLAYQEIGINYSEAKKSDSAEFYLRKSLKFPCVSNYYAIRNYFLAEVFFDQTEFDSASYYANEALKYPSTYFNKRDCYRILVNTEYTLGNIKQMASYMTKYQECTDSVRKIETQTKSSVLEDLYQSSDKVNKSRRYLLMLGFILVFLAVIATLIVLQLRMRNKRKEEKLRLTEAKLTTNQGILKENLIQKIEEMRIAQLPRFKKANMSERELMTKELYEVCLHTNNWDLFKKLMNQTYNNIITHLELNFKELNRKEIYWCCFYLLNLPNADIALILESQTTSLYKLKQRVSQKLILKSTKELEQYLLDISSESENE